MKALVLAPFAERSLKRLRQRLEVIYEPWTSSKRLQDPDELAARLRDESFSAVIVEADFLFEDALAAPKLRLAGICRNALNHVDLQAATEHGVAVIHTPSRNNAAVAELAVGLMLALARRIPAAHALVASGSWGNPLDAYVRFQGRELAKSTVGIVGLGQIGAETARRAGCLGARVLATDPFVSERRARALGARLVSLRQLLRRSDFISLHTPLTEATQRLVDGNALDLMKPTAYLVNTGAANVLDHEALIERLRARRIAGAALDVFPGQPLPASSPLLALDNVILTPHIGGATEETVARHSRMIVEDTERFLRGERPRRLANPEVLLKTARGR